MGINQKYIIIVLLLYTDILLMSLIYNYKDPLRQVLTPMTDTQKSPNTVSELKQMFTTSRPVPTPKALPRILCWVMCDPKDLDKRVIHQKMTWAPHCDVTLYMSSARNDTFPTIGLNVPSGRQHIGVKSRTAWTYLYNHYLDKAEYFVKCDPDTFLVIPNMKRYLANRNPDEAEMFGHKLYVPGSQRRAVHRRAIFNSGGPGQMLSREAVRRMVGQAFKLPGKPCFPDGEGEDIKTALCSKLVGTKLVDTRDSEGRETTLVFAPNVYVNGTPSWYSLLDVNGALSWWDDRKCCSYRPMAIHYVDPINMHVLYYLLYEMHHVNHNEKYSLSDYRFYNDTTRILQLSDSNKNT